MPMSSRLGSQLPMHVLTELVGRDEEVAALLQLLAQSRLVTLTGPGGIGKTRLSIEVGNAVCAQYPDGVWFLDLTGVDSSEALAPMIDAALAVPDQTTRAADVRLVEFLAHKTMLLIFDNCEHLLEASSSLVRQILCEAKDVRILATSRASLDIPGEHTFDLGTLAIPEITAAIPSGAPAALAALEQCPSVALFVQRARGVDPGFTLSEQTADAVVQVCQRLDGLPLALELAASRLRCIGVGDLAERLGQQLFFLQDGPRSAPDRQRTLENVVKWSYDLSAPKARTVWNRLSVFPDYFDLEAAEDICGFDPLAPEDVFALLDTLVSHSIVRAERGGPRVRFHQLTSIKLYGQRHLSPSESDQLRARHGQFYARRAVTMAANWYGATQAAQLDAARQNHGNIAAALETAYDTAQAPNHTAEFIAALRYHWVAGGFLSDGRFWAERFLALDSVTGRARAELLWVTSWIALIQGDHQRGAQLATQCADIAHTLDDARLRAQSSTWQALHHIFTGELEQALSLYEPALAAFRDAGDLSAVLTAGFQQAMALELSGNHRAALAACTEHIALAKRAGERWNRAHYHWVASMAHLSLGDFDAARTQVQLSLEIEQDFQDGLVSALTVEVQAWIEAEAGDHPRARELIAAAEDIWAAQGTQIEAFGPHMTQRAAKAQRQCGLHNRRAGRAAPPREKRTKRDAIEFALRCVRRESSEQTQTAADALANSPLTRREREVAALVGTGLTNRQVAEELVISPRTVEGHVENILAKLHLDNRSQLAVWIHAAPTHAPR